MKIMALAVLILAIFLGEANPYPVLFPEVFPEVVEQNISDSTNAYAPEIVCFTTADPEPMPTFCISATYFPGPEAIIINSPNEVYVEVGEKIFFDLTTLKSWHEDDLTVDSVKWQFRHRSSTRWERIGVATHSDPLVKWDTGDFVDFQPPLGDTLKVFIVKPMVYAQNQIFLPDGIRVSLLPPGK